MPPKKLDGAKAKQQKQKEQGELREDVLQAVVLADTFRMKFRPLTLEKPKVLLPLANSPMLDYTLELLVAAGVQEIFVVCSSHHEQITNYIRNSRWAPLLQAAHSSRKNKSLEIVYSADLRSMGDALRHIHAMDRIQDQFVLISGDVVSNLDLASIIKEHKACVDKDKHNILTLIMKKAPRFHRTRCLDDESITIIDKETNQLILTENESLDNSAQQPHLALPKELLNEHRALSFHSDLVYTHIAICTTEVLALFTENFDWEDLFTDFVRNVLGNELLGHRMFVRILKNEYAAQVQDLHMYDSITKDVLARWSYPFVPDNSSSSSSSSSLHTSSSEPPVEQYRYFPPKRYYREETSQVARTASLGPGCCLGPRTKVSNHSQLIQTVVGAGTEIGEKCLIKNSYLFEKVKVCDNVQMEKCIVADNCIIGEGAVLERGCVLGSGVVIAPGMRVPAYTKLTLVNDEDEDSDEESEPKWDEAIVGSTGKGRAYVRSSGDDDDEEEAEDENSVVAKFYLDSLAPDVLGYLNHMRSVLPDQYDSDEEGEEEIVQDDSHEKFVSEVFETLKRGEKEKLPVDAITLEMSSLKLSHDASLTDYATACFLAFFKLLNVFPQPAEGLYDQLRDGSYRPNKQLVADLTAMLKRWKSILTKFGRTDEDQTNYIFGLERVILKCEQYLVPLFRYLLQICYDLDILSEESILDWESVRADTTGPEAALVKNASVFLEWLKQEEEEEDEDEDE